MYRHILIAIDTSSESAEVLTKGIELAKLYSAKVSVIHALELPAPMVGELALVDTYFNAEEYTRAIRDSLVKLVTEAGLPVEALHIETGMPAMTVVDYADQNGVDLLVTGSHGKSGLKLLLGSVATGILHKAHCDVFVHRYR